MTYFQSCESRHEKGETWAGIEVLSGKIKDMSKVNIFEPLSVKKQIIKSANEAASMILKIDDVIASGKMKGPPPGAGGRGHGWNGRRISRRWRVLNTSEQKINVGPPKITRFEKARIVGARALQISMGAPILVDASENTNPIDIALKELDARILPITIRRTLPDGTFQDIPLKWLT